jgi:hypothetical protein
MQTDTPSAKWYRHITEMPLSRFIDVVVDDNFAALIITGYPPIEELQMAWGVIQGECADTVEGQEHKMYVSLFKEVNILALNLQTINCLVEMLEQIYYPEFAAALNKLLNTSFKFDPFDPAKYMATLKNCMMRSKAIKINLDLKQMQLQAMQAKVEEPGKKVTREYFQSILITLSNHVKYPVSDSITVYEYYDRLKRFNRECDELRKQVKNKANGR